MIISTFCTLKTGLFLGLHFVNAPTLLLVAGIAVTPISIASFSSTAVCFLVKHGKPITEEQFQFWYNTATFAH